jgi:hypothetical protein
MFRHSKSAISTTRQILQMYSLITRIGALVVASLATQAVAIPSNNRPDPFSKASWPLPHNITGVSNPGANQSYEGWGGVHLHDPSVCYEDHHPDDRELTMFRL